MKLADTLKRCENVAKSLMCNIRFASCWSCHPYLNDRPHVSLFKMQTFLLQPGCFLIFRQIQP